MLNLSSYHSNGLPAVVWSNKVNLIGEKVYKPKIHFCEHCNKPILLYGRLIPCKHVFCFSCATLCLSQQQQSSLASATADHDLSLDSPASNNSNALGPPGTPAQLTSTGSAKGCHRCGGKALRVERNILNSIFVCQIEACRRTYLSARDLQAHVNHRHSKHKSNNNHGGAGSASLAAISSSPYISSSSLLHLNSHSNPSTGKNQNGGSNSHNPQRHSASSSANHSNNNNNTNSPSYRHQQHHQRNRDRERFSDRELHQRDRDRDQGLREYHRQSLQRAAQWAEASAQMMEKGFTR